MPLTSTDLVEDALGEVFDLLTIKGLLSASLLCRKFKFITYDVTVSNWSDFLWNARLKRLEASFPLPEPASLKCYQRDDPRRDEDAFNGRSPREKCVILFGYKRKGGKMQRRVRSSRLL